MAILSGRNTPPSSEPPLDARLCSEIGAELARVRESRGLSPAQVGERLLLSVRQVRALETVEFAAFHNATFHVNALRKYATFADLDPVRVTAIAAALSRPAVPTASVIAEDSEAATEPPSRAIPIAVALVLAALAIVGGFYAVKRGGLMPASAATATLAPPPAPPPVVVTAPPQAVAAPPEVPAATPAPEVAPAATPVASAFGSVRVLHPTWIFVRDADNMVTERTLAGGEALELESQPTYLAIGSPDAELTIGTTPVDVSRFVANGQIRIRAGDFDALVQGASPIPAPTAAVRP